MEVADMVIITNCGEIEQIGTPEIICRNPKTDFVRNFIDLERFQIIQAIKLKD